MGLINPKNWPDRGDFSIVLLMFFFLFGSVLLAEKSVIAYYSGFSNPISVILGFAGSVVSIGTFALIYITLENYFESKQTFRSRLYSRVGTDYSDKEELVIRVAAEGLEFVKETFYNTSNVVNQILPTVIAFLLISKVVLILSTLPSFSFIPENQLRQGLIRSITSLFYLVALFTILTKDMHERPQIYPTD